MDKQVIHKAVEKHTHRIMRQKILEILLCEHPKPVDRKIIWFALDDLQITSTEEALDSNLLYLEERGYVRKEAVGGLELGSTVYYITAEGIDVMDGIKQNGGVAW